MGESAPARRSARADAWAISRANANTRTDTNAGDATNPWPVANTTARTVAISPTHARPGPATPGTNPDTDTRPGADAAARALGYAAATGAEPDTCPVSAPDPCGAATDATNARACAAAV